MGSSGGLWAAWDERYKLTLVYKCSNFIILLVVDERGLEWVLCLLYGHPRLGERKRIWEELGCRLIALNRPLLVAGDFNQVMGIEEKYSRNRRSIGGVDWLRAFINNLNLREVRSFGVFYTWTNNRSDEEVTFEKLDRAMANHDWAKFFPKSAVSVLPIQRSDHSPMVIDTHWEDSPRHRPKRFEEVWLRNGDVQQIISRVWSMSFSGSQSFQLIQRQNVLMRHLRNWGTLSYKALRVKIKATRDKLGNMQNVIAWQHRMSGQRQRADMMGIVRKERALREELDNLLAEEEIYWAQRAKQRWLDLGNRNSRYFHKAATIKRCKNHIVCLKNEEGQYVAGSHDIRALFVKHFCRLFSGVSEDSGSPPVGSGASGLSNPLGFDLLSSLDVRISDQDRESLDKPFVEKEVEEAVFQMGGLKAPGPDGFIAAFYQKNWNVVGREVSKVVLSFLHSGVMLKEINQTYITLIPKTRNPVSVNDFRPISLCNVLYKIIARVLVNRLRGVLGGLISNFQNAFVPGRQISDNILLAHELIECIKRKRKGKKAMFALKLDMSKAYDRVNWDFLVKVLDRMGFSPKWVNLIYQCISTVSFAVLVNGGRSETFWPKCGLRQGDPLSPYLFILVSQVLSSALSFINSNQICRGVAVGRGSPRVSHLFFADDSFFFMDLDTSHVVYFKWLLDEYCRLAGQKVNFNKSEVFLSPNAKPEMREFLFEVLRVKVVDKPGVYLGAELGCVKRKGGLFQKVLDRIGSRLACWRKNYLAFAGRVTLVKVRSIITCFQFLEPRITLLPRSAV